MVETLVRAYKILAAENADLNLPLWKIAEEILLRWDIRKLGEDLARRCIFWIVNYIGFPDREITKRVVGMAENKATELLPELPEEPHMDDIALLEERYFQEPRPV